MSKRGEEILRQADEMHDLGFGGGWNAALIAADQHIGALWSTLFNKDLVKAEAANFFDRERKTIRALKAVAEMGAAAPDDTGLVSGVSSEHTPPLPEPDRQPPSDGGLLSDPKPFAWCRCHPYHGVQFVYEALKPDDLKNGWNETPLYTRANPPTEPVRDEIREIATALIYLQEDMPSEDVRGCLGKAAHYLEKYAAFYATPTPEGGEDQKDLVQKNSSRKEGRCMNETARTETAIEAERIRCAEWCERMARLYDKFASDLREDGKYTYRAFLSWPPFSKKVSFVHHNWEKFARQKDSAAAACRMIKQAIIDGWIPEDNSLPEARDEG